MKTEVLTQRSNLWREMRVGVFTASRYSDIMTEPRTKAAREANEWSETAKSYGLEKLAELITGVPADTFHSEPTRWGMEHEAEAFTRAIPVIESVFGASIEKPEGRNAFILHPTEHSIGCSPDGVIGDAGLLELKCPWNPVNHLRTVRARAMPEKHTEQVQGSLWITGRQWYAFCSYDPRVEAAGLDPLFVARVCRDERYITEFLAPRVIRFRDWVFDEFERLTGKAPF